MTTTPANPFRASLFTEPPVPPCVIVIFGAMGDLALRKLFPALMNLAHDGLLPETTTLLGVSRREQDQNAFREAVFESARRYAPDVRLDGEFRRKFAERLFIVSEAAAAGATFKKLPQALNDILQAHGTAGNVLFYLSVPPSSYDGLVQSIGATGLAKGEGWRRIIVEKPFGRDLESARALNAVLSGVFREEQVYRIDHYMGKETVQNIMVLRLANSILEPLWNNQHIDHVQITAAETLGVEERAAYYEEAGALRDMIQNHLLQILAMIAMEPPASLNPEAVRNEKTKVLEAIRPLTAQTLELSAVRAQYGQGTLAGVDVPGYLQEKGVRGDSRTDTFCALRLWIDNWRWHGVPFYLRTGKRLPKRLTEVAIQFKPLPHTIFAPTPMDITQPNVLAIRIQPQEGITLRFIAKAPGHVLQLRSVDMEFRYGTSFGGRISDAYERLLLDAMLGDPTLFARRDAVELGWQTVEPILGWWEQQRERAMPHYAAGTWGPQEAEQLIEQDGRVWRAL